jgi:ribulose-phosphate 3-epimerase
MESWKSRRKGDINMYKLAPSILSADFARLGEQISILEENGVEWLHIDVMDGAFVPQISFGMPVIKSIRKSTKLFFDVHMMVEEPGRFTSDAQGVRSGHGHGARGGVQAS